MSNIKLFESKKVRTDWNAKTVQWYFSVIDVVEILTASLYPRYRFKGFELESKTGKNVITGENVVPLSKKKLR